MQVSNAILGSLIKAGWFEGRSVLKSVALPAEFELFSKAAEVLSEFGNLTFGEWGPGIDCGTCDVTIDPSLGSHLGPDLIKEGKAFGTKLYPLGEIDRGHGYLIIDELGRVYLLSGISDDFEPFARTFPEALDQLLLGKLPAAGDIEKAWPSSGNHSSQKR